MHGYRRTGSKHSTCSYIWSHSTSEISFTCNHPLLIWFWAPKTSVHHFKATKFKRAWPSVHNFTNYCTNKVTQPYGLVVRCCTVAIHESSMIKQNKHRAPAWLEGGKQPDLSHRWFTAPKESQEQGKQPLVPLVKNPSSQSSHCRPV